MSLNDKVKEKANEIKSKYAAPREAQKWLDEKYPKESVYKGTFDLKNRGKKRDQIEELKIDKKLLKGELDLRDFTKLKKLDCSDNQITFLNVICSAYTNELDELDLNEVVDLFARMSKRRAEFC